MQKSINNSCPYIDFSGNFMISFLSIIFKAVLNISKLLYEKRLIIYYTFNRNRKKKDFYLATHSKYQQTSLSFKINCLKINLALDFLMKRYLSRITRISFSPSTSFYQTSKFIIEIGNKRKKNINTFVLTIWRVILNCFTIIYK